MKVEEKLPFDPKIFLARVGTGKTRAELRKRQIVFSQGDPADAVFYIHKGKIELKVLSEQGKEAILAILGIGDFFGEGCLAGQPLRMATAAAATECSVMRRGTGVRRGSTGAASCGRNLVTFQSRTARPAARPDRALSARAWCWFSRARQCRPSPICRSRYRVRCYVCHAYTYDCCSRRA